MPAMIIESTSAGPANCAAAVPVMTKMPAPMIAPTPSVVRLNGPSVRRSVSVCGFGGQLADRLSCEEAHAAQPDDRARREDAAVSRARSAAWSCQSLVRVRLAKRLTAIVRAARATADSIMAPASLVRSAVRARTPWCSLGCSCAPSAWRRMLAYEAHDAARSHRATAERALQDYAAVAAWELVAGVTDQLQTSSGGALAPIDARARGVALRAAPGADVLAASADSVLRCPDAERRLGALLFPHRLSRWLARDVGRRAVAGDAHAGWSTRSRRRYAASTSRIGRTPSCSAVRPASARSRWRTRVKYAEHSSPIAAYRLRDLRRRHWTRRSFARDRAARAASGVGQRRREQRLARRHHRARSIGTNRVSVRGVAAVAVLRRRSAQAGRPADRARGDSRRARSSCSCSARFRRSRVPWLVGLLMFTAAMIAVTVHAAAPRARAGAAASGFHLERVARAAHAAVADSALC